MVDEEYPEQSFSEKSEEIPSVNPERTFLEKIFLLHEEFQKTTEKIRVDRLSRHLYDLYALSKTEYAEIALQKKELYETIVKHRMEFTKITGIDYSLHSPSTINPIPPENIIELWEKDYAEMREEMVYGENRPTFSKIIETLKRLKDKINSLNWEMI